MTLGGLWVTGQSTRGAPHLLCVLRHGEKQRPSNLQPPHRLPPYGLDPPDRPEVEWWCEGGVPSRDRVLTTPVTASDRHQVTGLGR